MNNDSRIGLIITVMLMSPFIGAAELDDAQKCNEIKGDPDLTIQYCTTADRNIARENAQGEEQYGKWLRSVEDAEKNNQHLRK